MQLPRREGTPDASVRELNEASDQELLVRVRFGDAAAFEALFRRYYTALCGFTAGYTRSLEIAEELVQDVLASVWERRESLNITTSVQAYLYAAARNKAFSHAARGRVERRWTEEVVRRQPAGEPIDRSAVPDSEFYAGELGVVVQRIVADMPERRRIIYQLSRDRHMAYAEIAEVLGIAPKTVEIQISRALKAIRDGLVTAGWLEP